MKLTINKNQINGQPEQWLRQAGYGFIRDRKTGHDSFVRRLGSGFYPRLHMYFVEQDGKIILNLHLDQKQASYKGARMHNAEHDSEVVVNEIDRLKSLLNMNNNDNNEIFENNNPLDKIGSGEYDKKAKPKLEKSWWRRIF